MNNQVPYSPESEAAILGAIMLSDEVWSEVGSKLTLEHFYLPDNQKIFQACQGLIRNGDTPDLMLVALACEDAGHEIDRQTISDTVAAGDAYNVKAYMTILNRQLTKRRAIEKAQDVLKVAYDEAADKVDVLEKADVLARDLHELQTDSGDPRHMKDIARATLEQIEARHENQDQLMGRTTGIAELDTATQGLCDGQLIVVAGRPGMGKNIVLNQFIKAAARAEDAPIIVFSLEMRAEQLASRMLSDIGSIPFGNLRSGKLNRDDFTGMTGAYNQIKAMNIHIDDTPGQTIYDMSAKVKRMGRKYGKVGMICIDYLQLINGTNQRQDDVSKITEVTRELKILALQLECPVALLSQLSRGVEQRPCKRPMSSDLRGSGSIEQDADVILMAYRDEYYNPDSVDKGTMELIRTKVREGEPGTTRVQFLGQFQRICDLPTGYTND